MEKQKILGILAVLAVVGIGVILLTSKDDPIVKSLPRGPWQDSEQTPIHEEVVRPSADDQVVKAGDLVHLRIPGNLLAAEQKLKVATLTGGPEPKRGLPSQPLGVFEISLGDVAYFTKPLVLAFSFDPAKLSSPIPPEFSLVASYWDEELETWIEVPSLLDPQKNLVVVPTLHLTKFRIDEIKADGHLYNDHFSLFYDKGEQAALMKKYANFEKILADYPAKVFASLNRANDVYRQCGFRELEKIEAIKSDLVSLDPSGADLPPYAQNTILVKKMRYNAYLIGDRQNADWSWKGVVYSNLSRSKYTGNIYIPYDYGGMDDLEVGHEVFHSIQNRYYNFFGMTEFGVPGTSSPSTQFQNRLGWLEGTAEYAAGALVDPGPDGSPNPRMGGAMGTQSHDRPLNHSPSNFRANSEKSAYANAWFVHFLVTEKGIDFKELFEKVASYHWPSVYDNLVGALQEKSLDLNEVYHEYSSWWHFSPHSPMQTKPAGQIRETSLAARLSKLARSDLRDWSFEGGAGPHRSRIWAIDLKGRPSPPKALIVSLEKERAQNLRVDFPLRTLGVNKWNSHQGMTEPAVALTPTEPLQIVPVEPGDELYLLAVRNDDLGGVLGHWYPEVRITEAELSIEPSVITDGSESAVYQFLAKTERLPEALIPRLRLEWIRGGKIIPADKPHDAKATPGRFEAHLANQSFLPGNHLVTARLYADRDLLLAESQVKVAIKKSGPAQDPNPKSDQIRWEKMRVTGTPGNGWDPIRGILETTKGPYSSALEGATGIRPGESSGFRWKATTTFSGQIRSDQARPIPQPADLAEEKNNKHRQQMSQPGVSGRVSSGALSKGNFTGAFAEYLQEQKRSGDGTAYSWEYVGAVVSGNALFDQHASVEVRSFDEKHDTDAKNRFNQLVQEARAAMNAIEIRVE